MKIVFSTKCYIMRFIFSSALLLLFFSAFGQRSKITFTASEKEHLSALEDTLSFYRKIGFMRPESLLLRWSKH